MEDTQPLLSRCNKGLVKKFRSFRIMLTNLGTVRINLSSLGSTVILQKKLSAVFALSLYLHLSKSGQLSRTPTIREYSSICDQLSSIGKPVDDSMKICSFINGLGREYDAIITVIQSPMSRLPTPTFQDIVFEIQGFDARLQTYETPSVTPTMAFPTQPEQQHQIYQTSGSYNRGRGSNSRFGSNRGHGGYSLRGRGFYQQNGSTGPPNKKAYLSDL